MMDREELIEWFEDPETRGVASNADVAELLEVPEGFVRGKGRERRVRRIGSAMCWTLDDVLELCAELEDEEEDEDESDDDLEEDDDENEDGDADDE